MDYQSLETSLEDGVYTIRLNRPEKRNMMTFAMSDELRHAAAQSSR